MSHTYTFPVLLFWVHKMGLYKLFIHWRTFWKHYPLKMSIPSSLTVSEGFPGHWLEVSRICVSLPWLLMWPPHCGLISLTGKSCLCLWPPWTPHTLCFPPAQLPPSDAFMYHLTESSGPMEVLTRTWSWQAWLWWAHFCSTSTAQSPGPEPPSLPQG